MYKKYIYYLSIQAWIFSENPIKVWNSGYPRQIIFINAKTSLPVAHAKARVNVHGHCLSAPL